MAIPIPPLPEQQRIVAKLDGLMARSARARADLDRVPVLAARYKEAVLLMAYSGQLTADFRGRARRSGEGLRKELLDQRRERLRRAGHRVVPGDADVDFGAEADLPRLPEGWTWMPVMGLATKVVDGVHKKPNYIASGIPFVTVKNLTAGPELTFEGCRFVSAEDHAEFCRRTQPERGDILISKDGTLGVARAVRADKPFSLFVSVALVKPIDPSFTDYLELAFQSPILQRQMGGVGSGLQHIHLTDLRKDMIPVAPTAEREEIVRRTKAALAEIDRLAAEAAAARRLLDRLDQAILDKAFRGELVPQDPADEPASILLDRIRVEQAGGPTGARRGRRPRAA